MSTYLDRTIELLGLKRVNQFKDKTVLVVGLGGVGGTCLMALARSGFMNFIIVDHDIVDESNINRQIFYFSDDVGKNKVDICETNLKRINPNINIIKFNMFVGEDNLDVFNSFNIDFIVDAIDKIPSKIALIKYAKKRNIKLIVSLGMGNKINPENVKITKLDKTSYDPLAKVLRYKLRKENIDTKTIDVAFSNESPRVRNEKPSSMMMVPSTAGLLMAKFIIENI